MNSKEYREFLQSYNGIYEKIEVPADSTDAEALKGLIPKGEKVHEVPKKKSTLQNASYEPDGEIIDEAGGLSGRNYGDPVAAKWNKDMGRFNVQGRGREMTPPSIPAGYSYNQQAGTITKGGASPTPATAKPRPPAPTSRNLSGLSVGPGGFNINNKPVRTATPVTPDSRRDPEFRRGPGSGAGDMNAGKPTPVSAKPTAQAPVKPATKPAPTAAKPAPTIVKPTPTAPTVPSTSASAKPSSQLADLQKMRMASQMRQKGANVVSTQLASFDLFDIVMGHLLDEGYADTEEAALKIMANMSEEWRQSIVEKHATFGYNAEDPLDDFEKFVNKGPKTNAQKRKGIELNNKILSKPGMPVKVV